MRLDFNIPGPTGISDKQARSAVLFLLSNARDAEDGRELLEACGLLPRASGDGKPRGEGQ